jgi:hypothetical protein
MLKKGSYLLPFFKLKISSAQSKDRNRSAPEFRAEFIFELTIPLKLLILKFYYG